MIEAVILDNVIMVSDILFNSVLFKTFTKYDLTTTQRFILLVLAQRSYFDHIAQARIVSVALSELESKYGVSKSYSHKCIRKLCSLGILKRLQIKDKNPPYEVNKYEFLYEVLLKKN